MTILISGPFQSAILAGLICCVVMGGDSENLDALDLSQCQINWGSAQDILCKLTKITLFFKLGKFQVHSIVVQHLYTLQCDHDHKSSNLSSPFTDSLTHFAQLLTSPSSLLATNLFSNEFAILFVHFFSFLKNIPHMSEMTRYCLSYLT